MNRAVWVAMLVVVICLLAFGQTGFNSFYQNTYTTTGPDNVPPGGKGIVVNGVSSYVQLIWTVTGAPAACTVALDSSPDGVNWTAGGAIAGQTCTSNGSSVVTTFQPIYARINVTALSGGATLSVKYYGWPVNPAAGSANISNLLGTSQGQPIVGGSSGAVNSPSEVNVNGFTGTDPCNTINLALQKQVSLNVQGMEINAKGLSAGSSAPCNYATANFLGGVAIGSMGGTVKFGGVTLWEPLVPSAYGCVTATCTNGPFPPRGVIVLPNFYHGLEGIGRGNAGGQNTTIAICAATHTGATCNSATNTPVQRQWTISTTVITPFALSGGAFVGHRNYMQINTAGDNYTATCTAPVGGVVTCTVNGNSPTNNISGELSGGMTITLGGAFTVLTGSQTVSDGSGAGAAPLTNASGQTVFTIATATTCGVCTGTITVGFNVIGGEHVSVVGSSVLNNNFVWRVCQKTTGGSFPNIGVQNDPNCPANPSVTSFYVVGTSSDLLNNFSGAVTSTGCSSACGTVFGEIPIVDYGSNPGNFQFGMFLKSMTLACNTVPSCTNFRSTAANEESGMQTMLLNGSSMWCGSFYSNNAQDANNWNDIECVAGISFNGSQLTSFNAGTTGFIVNESAMRAMRGATVNFNSAGGTSGSSNFGTARQGQIGICGMIIEATSTSTFQDVHSEGFQFGRCYGIGEATQGYIGIDNGGQAAGSCGNVTSAAAGQGCAPDDGPFANVQSTSVAPGAAGQTTLTFASPPSGCQWISTIPTNLASNGLGMLVTIEAIGSNSGSCSATTGLGTNCVETVSMTGPVSGNTIPITGTQNIHNNAATQVSCGWSSAEMVSGNFPLAMGGGQSGPYTGDFAIHDTKRNTGAMFSIIDDYSGALTNDNVDMLWVVDTAFSGGQITRKTTSAVAKDLYPQCLLGGATGTASPAACSYNTVGKIAIPASAGTSYTVNEATVGANSLIYVQQTTDNTGLPNSPTCNSNAELPSVAQITKSNGISFTMNGLSNPAAITCFTYQVLN